jgi:hypothetical protein
MQESRPQRLDSMLFGFCRAHLRGLLVGLDRLERGIRLNRNTPCVRLAQGAPACLHVHLRRNRRSPLLWAHVPGVSSKQPMMAVEIFDAVLPLPVLRFMQLLNNLGA